jgi:hypothetical protein
VLTQVTLCAYPGEPTCLPKGTYVLDSEVCAQYIDFLDRVQMQTQKLLKQGYVSSSLSSSLQNFYGRHHDLIDQNIHMFLRLHLNSVQKINILGTNFRIMYEV